MNEHFEKWWQDESGCDGYDATDIKPFAKAAYLAGRADERARCVEIIRHESTRAYCDKWEHCDCTDIAADLIEREH